MLRGRRVKLEALRTGDGHGLPPHLKAQVLRELDRLELVLEQVKAVEEARDARLSVSSDSDVPALSTGAR
jgi:transposase